MSNKRLSESGLLLIRDFGPHRWYAFYCPGCQQRHTVQVGGDGDWTFNGDEASPTFRPSILFQGTVPITDDEADRIMKGEVITPRPLRCHSYVTSGKIYFLSDCYHALAGGVVDMQPIILSDSEIKQGTPDL